MGTTVENCDAADVASGSCTLSDGTVVSVSVISNRALAISVRPPSNYYWRSSPFEVNGTRGDDTLLPGSDFRLVYWMGRYVEGAK
jgi:hypothetical protein